MVNIIDSLNWRYANKLFDKDKKLSSEQIQNIKDILRLTPTAFGIQAYKFYIISNQELKEKMRGFSRNQSQVSDCSHLIVFVTPKELTMEYIDYMLEQRAQIVSRDDSKKSKFKQRLLDYISNWSSEETLIWMQKQVYVALGNLMTAVADLKIDACALELIETKKYDEILNLDSQGLTCTIACALGIRDNNDKYLQVPKFRLSEKDLFIEL